MAFHKSILLKFDFYTVIVIDTGSEFRGLFQKLCSILNIRFHPVDKRNHKAVGVERFDKFLNHS